MSVRLSGAGPVLPVALVRLCTSARQSAQRHQSQRRQGRRPVSESSTPLSIRLVLIVRRSKLHLARTWSLRRNSRDASRLLLPSPPIPRSAAARADDGGARLLGAHSASWRTVKRTRPLPCIEPGFLSRKAWLNPSSALSLTKRTRPEALSVSRVRGASRGSRARRRAEARPRTSTQRQPDRQGPVALRGVPSASRLAVPTRARMRATTIAPRCSSL